MAIGPIQTGSSAIRRNINLFLKRWQQSVRTRLGRIWREVFGRELEDILWLKAKQRLHVVRNNGL